jgi:hypothetical protein
MICSVIVVSRTIHHGRCVHWGLNQEPASKLGHGHVSLKLSSLVLHVYVYTLNSNTRHYVSYGRAHFTLLITSLYHSREPPRPEKALEHLGRGPTSDHLRQLPWPSPPDSEFIEVPLAQFLLS